MSDDADAALRSELIGASGFFRLYADPLFVLDPAWKITYLNPAAVEFFGKRALLHGFLWDLWPAAQRSLAQEVHQRALDEQKGIQIASPVGERWVEVRVCTCPFGTVAYYHDVTPERKLTELQERLSAVVESADDAILSKNLDGVITSWNRGAEKLFGYTAAETVGQHISMLAPADVVDEIPKILARIRSGERVDHYETKRKTKDGRVLTISLTVSPIRDASGTIIGASKVARNITETKRLSELQERLAAIVESSDDAIISKNLDGIVTSWNTGAEKLLGYTAHEMIGQHISVLAPAAVADEIPRILARIRSGERVDHYETKRKTKDGRVLTLSLTISPIRDGTGAIIGASKVARDITQREQQEKALRQVNAELLRSNEDLQQFAYSASHDLQEPLRMVATYSELLKERFGGQLGPQGELYLKFTVEGALRMERLLKDLRAYTKASTEQPEQGHADANLVLEKAIANIKALVNETRAVINRSPLPEVRLHEFQLEQLFQNLIGNAIHYRSNQPPVITVSAVRQQAEWVFSVQDNGMGIDPKYQEHIFGMFKRLHTASEYPGTGMGLAICQRIVERAGGRIWVESALGKGATFYFTIPA